MTSHQVNYTALTSLREFHASEARNRLIVGPFRSGKSAAAVMDLFTRAMQMKDSRTCCVRKTYRNLEDTVIKTFFEWIPKAAGEWRQADLMFRMKTPLGGTWEIFFRSAESADDIEKFRGFELTNYWIDEAQEVPQDVKLVLDGRLSYPTGSDRSVFKGILTTNPCDTEHWIYKMFVMDPLPDHAYWRQGANENPYLHKEYYSELEANYRDRPELMRRYVHGEWGAIFSGKPVYGNEFNWEWHVAKKHLVPVEGLPIYCGWDFGLNPAMVFTQIHPNGQWMILREMYADDMGFDEFSDAVIDYSNREFPRFTFVDVGDPAGKARAATDETSCYDILRKKKRMCRAAPTNALIPRLEAVKRRLIRSVKGNPMLVMDARCKRLIDGFSGGYRYKDRGGTGTFCDTPEKNIYSHVHDAVQYVALNLFGYAERNSRLMTDPLPNQLGVQNA